MDQIPSASAGRSGDATIGRERGAVALFAALWIAWVGALGWLRATHPGIDHGDPTTDSNILNAGENWDRNRAAGGSGPWASWGIPAVDTFRGGGKTPDWYTTYPPGAYWFHQAVKSVARAVGLPRDAGVFRAVSVAVSGLAVLVLFALVRRVGGPGSAVVALAACAVYMLARPVVEYADNLHYISLGRLTLLATVYAWVRYEGAETARWGAAWLAACAGAFLLDSWLTFEHAMFVVLFAAVRCVWARRPGRLVAVGLLGCVPVLVLGVRLLMNRAVLGSFRAAVDVLRAKAEQRVGSGATGTGWSALAQAWGDRLSWPGAAGPVDGAAAEFTMPLVSWWVGAPLAALAVLLIATWHVEAMKPARRTLGLGLLLLAGGLTWFAVMTEHAIVHRFDAMLIAPGVGVTVGALAAAGLMQRRFQPPGAPVRLIGLLLGVGVVGVWIGSLKSSYALNTVVRAEASVREAVARRAEALSAFAAAGRALADGGVKRLWMLERDAPAGRALGVPFDNAAGEQVLAAPLAVDAALLVPLWNPSGRRQAAALTETHGLPDVISSLSAGAYVVFRAGRGDADRVAHAARSGLRIDRMAWRATLDGAGWVLAARVSGPLDELRAAGVELRIVGADGDTGDARGAPLAALGVPGADGVRAENAAVVWAVLDRARLRDVGAVELRAAVPGRPARWGWDDGGVVRWSPAPWQEGPRGVER